jgi:K+-transporting ATPase A subunit
MTRAILYIFFPIAFVFGIIFVGQGAVQTLAGRSIHNLLNGVTQTIARGPIGFMESIKQLGNNGGGFLNANSATTFENPTGLTAGCRSTCCWPSPSPSPTPSARWWAASATAPPCWPPW